MMPQRELVGVGQHGARSIVLCDPAAHAGIAELLLAQARLLALEAA